MLHGKLQHSALACGGSELIDPPLEGSGIEKACGPLGGCGKRENAEAGVDHVVDDDIGRTRLGNIFGKVFKDVFKLFIIRGDDDIRRIRIGRPVAQRLLVNAVAADETDDINNGAHRLGGCRNGVGIDAGSGLAVGKHDHDLLVGRWAGKQLGSFGEGVCVVGIAACGKSVDRAFQIGNTGNELRVFHGGAGKADNGDTAAAADLPVLRAVCGGVDDVDKFVRAAFEAGKRLSDHAAGAVKDQHDVSWVACDVRLRGE